MNDDLGVCERKQESLLWGTREQSLGLLLATTDFLAVCMAFKVRLHRGTFRFPE
ncbi:MAG: hypothetical protein AB7F90_16230 [Nitrospirales bacterium]